MSKIDKEVTIKKLQEKIDELTISIINAQHYDQAQYLQGFKQGLLDALYIVRFHTY